MVGKIDNLFYFTDCSCGMAEESKKLKSLVESLQRDLSLEVMKNKKLAEENARLEIKNGKLQEALTSKLLPEPETPFKDCDEFLDANTLRQFSLEATSDYIFMKFLMMRLWPDGLVGRSVTGRQSNNPSGRPRSSKADGTTGENESNESDSIDFSAESEETSNGTNDEESAAGISHVIVKLGLETEKVDYCIRKFISNFLY